MKKRQPFGRVKRKLCLHGFLLRPTPAEGQYRGGTSIFSKMAILGGTTSKTRAKREQNASKILGGV